MSERSEKLYTQLRNREAVLALIGSAEDADLEFKEWRGGDSGAGSIAKAACGFANATGGVLLVGIAAANRRDEPDIATQLAPVAVPEAVKAQILDLLQKKLDPGVVGIEADVVVTELQSGAGVIVVHVPESSLPQRSRFTKEFYTRISAGTNPMEMYQIADRFGRRPQARLSVLEPKIVYGSNLANDRYPLRKFTVRVRNDGRGLAQYPALFLNSRSTLAALGMFVPEWFLSGADDGWSCYRGGADKVVYPGETRWIVDAFQRGLVEGGVAEFGGFTLRTKVVCLDMVEVEQSFSVEAGSSTDF